MRILYLPYEIRSREFITYQYLANEIINSGIVDEVLIGPREVIEKLALLGLLEPGIWLLKSAQSYVQKKIKKLKKRKFKIIVHDAESICTFELKGSHDCFMKPSKTLKFVDAILTSSKSETKTVKNLNPKLDVRESGFLRFEYLKNEDLVKAIYKKEVKLLKKLYGEYIYIILSGTVSKFTNFKDFSTEIKNYKIYNMQDWRIDIQRKWIDVSHLCFFSLLEFIRLLLTQKEELKIVIRPHPSEDRKFLSKLFLGFNNVFIDNTHSLHSSILAASKIIVSPVSTTSFECAILKKEAFCLSPNLFEYNHELIKSHITNSFVTIVEDPEKLKLKITNNSSSSQSEINQRKSKALNYANNNNKSLDVFINLIKDLAISFPKRNFKLIRFSYLRNKLLIISASAYEILGYLSKKIKYANHKLKGSEKIPIKLIKKKYPENHNYEFESFLQVIRK